ncbi:MAG: hypothetical protein US52_C0006G0009 [candidate division WS6 bacterium GW2011_GWA2_37_6]|uniref:Uncharacterized protein n=1 Tax=candidate division WS6 bacterium GW2011_GWA2_37_6 TaxID=1619087 RepID=A0A0G0JHE1_9BACT|nr:MAG: hypothetical protein US52_C0006G0009 [candidate division WS6 bacterium GW2011_GWA2_37_6]
MKKQHKFTSTKDLLLAHDFIGERKKAAKYVTHEFQDYGYRLAVKLNDLSHKSLYIRLAKNTKRAILDQALSFTLDYPKAKKKAKIFMWKLSELRKGDKENKQPTLF